MRVISSIREVVDADGVAIISNEVFDRNSSMPSFAALRSSTMEVLAEHGFGSRSGAAA
jgi:hypothetical protein